MPFTHAACPAFRFRSIHLYAAGGSAGGGRQIARMELGEEETWRSGRWQTGGGLETKEGRPNRPAVSSVWSAREFPGRHCLLPGVAPLTLTGC